VAVVDFMDVYVDVYTVEYGARKLPSVLHNLVRQAATGLAGAVMATRAGVCCGYENEVRWVFSGFFSAGDGNGASFKRLTECLHGHAPELWELIEQQDTAVCEAHFARPDTVAATNYGDIASTMMWRPERPCGYELIEVIAS
jgi:hypothetical protein